MTQEWSQQDQLFVEDNTRMIHLREKEIDRILHSISELNSIFKELATMVTEQVQKKAIYVRKNNLKILFSNLFFAGHNN